MQKTKNKAFTLVELIVVITILAILGTIAFISLQGYSKTSRDAARISDISIMKTSLEVFQLDSGKYPIPTSGTDITYSGTTVWTQGSFGDSVFNNVSKLDKIPTDPLSDSYYTYSVTSTRNQYEIGGITELDELTFSNNKTNAGDIEAFALVKGNYNGLMTKTVSGATCNIISVPTIIANDIETSNDLVDISTNKRFVKDGYKNLPSSFLSSKFNIEGGFDFEPNSLVAFSGACESLLDKTDYTARVEMLDGLKNAYNGTILQNDGEIKNIIDLVIDTNSPSQEVINFAGNFVNNNLGGKVVTGGNSSAGGTTALVEQTLCEQAGWYWISDTNDVKIGTSTGNGFCISPRIGDFGTNAGDGISWNGRGSYGISDYNGWNVLSYTDTRDDGNSMYNYGQTRKLKTPAGYSCTPLGSASSGYDMTDGKGDTIYNRMKWLVTNKNNLTSLRSIGWIIGATPPNSHPIPALFIADCIDGENDLGFDMQYTHITGTTETITYAQYSTNVTSSTTSRDLTNVTYQNRLKYLIGWTQKKGSHLPSAFTYTSSGKLGPCNEGVSCENLTGDDRGEYQVACESHASVSDIGENIWLAVIGNQVGDSWGHGSFGAGLTSCGSMGGTGAGARYKERAARFIIRP